MSVDTIDAELSDTVQASINPHRSIEALMTTLVSWLKDVLPGTTPAHLTLNGAAPSAGTAIRLIGITPGKRATDQAFVHLSCDMLVTVADADPLREGTAFARLLLAALDRPEMTVLDEPPVLPLCAALGMPPALGCILRVSAFLPKTDERPTRRVRFPLVAEIGEMRDISGTVLGPGGVPVAGVAVSAEGFRRHTRTDRSGRFQLRGIAVGGERLTVRGRGIETIADVAETNEPITIHLPLEV